MKITIETLALPALLLFFVCCLFAFCPRCLTTVFLLALLLHPSFDNLNALMAKKKIFIISPFGIISLLLAFVSLTYLIAVKKKPIIAKLPLFKPFLLFLLIALSSVLFSNYTIYSLREFAELCTIFLVYLLAANILNKPKDLKRLVNIIIISSFVPITFALYQVISKTGTIEWGIMRVKGTMSHYNGLAFYLLIVLPFIFEKFAMRWQKGKTSTIAGLCWLIMFLTTVFVIIKTYTRSAWLGMAAEFLALFVLGRKKLLLTFCLIFLFIPLFVLDVILRIEEVFVGAGNVYGVGPTSSSLMWRIRTWSKLLNLFFKKPFLGYGIGTSFFLSKSAFNETFMPHNDYLRVLLEMGLIGLACFLILWFSLLFTTLNIYKTTTNDVTKSSARAFTAVIIGYLIISFSDNIFNYSLLLWPLFSIAGSLHSAQRNENIINK